jgi:hypothetical protein
MMICFVGNMMAWSLVVVVPMVPAVLYATRKKMVN